MDFDLSKLPDNIKIETTVGALKTFGEVIAKRVIEEVLSNGSINKEEDDITNFQGMLKILDIAESTGYAKTSSGEIPHFKKGRKLLFRKSELMQYIESGKRKTTTDIDDLAEQYLRKAS